MIKELYQYKEKAEETAEYLRGRLPGLPDTVIISGTGLGLLADDIEGPLVFPYSTIPNFPVATGPSHAGNLVCGLMAGNTVAVMQGRFHYYEGYSTSETTFPLRVMALLGVRNLVVANAAGGLNPEFTGGDLMLITDHLNFIPDNPLRGPNFAGWGERFPDMSDAYSKPLQEKAMIAAERLGIAKIRTGIYCAVPGPSLETPAETRYLRNSGADAVGMSTVPEVIVARHAGMQVLAFSVIANVNDPDNFKPIILEEVVTQTEIAAVELATLIREVVPEI